MKAHWITSTIIATAFFLAPAGIGFAKDKQDTPSIKGRVTAVDTTAKTITISVGKKAENKGPQTISISNSTAIKIDGTSATLADIKPKMGAMISLDADGKTAKRVMIKSPKAAGGGAAPAEEKPAAE